MVKVIREIISEGTMRSIILLIIGILFILPTGPLTAQDEEITEKKTVPPVPEVDIPEISVDELMAIIDRADNFFSDQDIENMAVDIIIYRDPGKQLTLQDLKSGEVEYKAKLSPIYAHYFYETPGWFQLKIMGIIVASSDLESPTNYTSLLPLPGGQINIPSVMDNYDLVYLGYGEVNDRQTHRIRLAAKDFDKQFIRYSIYDFDVEEGYLSRIESHFDDGGFFQGHGSGEFYYSERSGRLLPAYGNGEIFFRPFFHINLWGSWFKWKFNSEDFMGTLSRGDEDKRETINIGGS